MRLRKLLLFLETKNLKNLKFGLLGFLGFLKTKNLGFLKATSTALVQPFSRNVADKETKKERKKSPKNNTRPPTGGGVKIFVSGNMAKNRVGRSEFLLV